MSVCCIIKRHHTYKSVYIASTQDINLKVNEVDKQKRYVASKRLTCFPIIPSLQRLFMARKTVNIYSDMKRIQHSWD